MVKVKICGLTNLRDALKAVEYGADALGFNFYPSSPRCMSVANTVAIVDQLPTHVCKVGVFVNEPRKTIESVIKGCKTDRSSGLTAVQFHGDEDPDYCAGWSLKVIKALRIKDSEVLEAVDNYPADLFLLDSWSTRFGGSGTSFNWQWLAGRMSNRVILAGGLDVGNIHQAVRELAPFAVDVCSGVESAPGVKDHVKMRDFIAVAKGS